MIEEDVKTKLDFSEKGKVILVCKDGTRQPLSKQEIIFLNMGIYKKEFLDKKYNSEPRKA